MGPTYVKLGQVLSGRPDLLPEPYLKALARLQDKVKPFSIAEVEQIVSTELGVRISKAFSRFDPVPIAAASLGQVHSAALRDGRLASRRIWTRAASASSSRNICANMSGNGSSRIS
jgi:predicted unusual protein kinase regulating ubiquinone biosynthesis (AarF/ABC1/UbiB family)